MLEVEKNVFVTENVFNPENTWLLTKTAQKTQKTSFRLCNQVIELKTSRCTGRFDKKNIPLLLISVCMCANPEVSEKKYKIANRNLRKLN